MPKKRQILFDPTKLWKTNKDTRDILHGAEVEKDKIILKHLNKVIHKEIV